MDCVVFNRPFIFTNTSFSWDLPNVFQDVRRYACSHPKSQQVLRASLPKSAVVDLTVDDLAFRAESRTDVSATLLTLGGAVRTRKESTALQKGDGYVMHGRHLPAVGSVSGDITAFENRENI